MKKSVILWILLALVLAFVAFRIISNQRKTKASHAAAAPRAVPVDVYIAHDTVVDYNLRLVGSVMAFETVDIVSEISRRLVKIGFTEGTMVEKGKVLFKLDDADLLAEMARLRAREELAIKNEYRKRLLLEAGGVNQQEYDEQLNELKTIQAEISGVQVQLDRSEIRAPFSGRVGIRNVSPGAMLSPSMVLTTLKDVSRVKVFFFVPERYASDLSVGKEVSFELAGRNEKYVAVIQAIQAGIDERTRSIEVMAVADNKDGKIIPGASATVMLAFQESTPSVFVPTQSLIPTNKGYEIYHFKNGTAMLKEVVTGMRSSEYVQVMEGVAQGDTLITTNLLRIRNGSAVNIAKIH